MRNFELLLKRSICLRASIRGFTLLRIYVKVEEIITYEGTSYFTYILLFFMFVFLHNGPHSLGQNVW